MMEKNIIKMTFFFPLKIFSVSKKDSSVSELTWDKWL